MIVAFALEHFSSYLLFIDRCYLGTTGSAQLGLRSRALAFELPFLDSSKAEVTVVCFCVML
jgi:hypothetical protein